MTALRAVGAAVRRRQELAVYAVTATVLGGVALLPILAVTAELPAVASAQGWQWTVATARTLVLLLAQSAVLAAAVTAVALALGLPLGVVLSRFDVPYRRALLLAHGFPVCLPPFLLALGWFHVFGRDGALGFDATARVLFSPVGLVSVMALALTPIVTSLVVLGLHAIEPSLEEAARVVAPASRVATRILFPLCLPAAALGAVVVFALAFSELGVAAFLRVRTYPAAVFARLGGIDYAPGEAAALAAPMVVVAIALLLMERRITRRWGVATMGLRSGEGGLLPLGRWRVVVTILCVTVIGIGLVPIVSLVMATGRAGAVAVPMWLGSSLRTSLVTAATAATGIAAIGVAVGHAVARRRTAGTLLDSIGVFAFLVPAGVLGVGLITTWNRPATRAIYGTLAIIVVGYVARYSFVGVRAATLAIAQSPRNLEDAAAACGAGYLRRLRRIIVPLHARGIAGAWFLALVFCLRDVDLSVLFYPAGNQPLPVRIYTLEANGPPHVVAALAVTHVMVTALVVALGLGVMSGRRPARHRAARYR